MAEKKSSSGYKRSGLGAVLAIFLLALAILWQDGRVVEWFKGLASKPDISAEQESLFTVHCLDVGQASATLIVSGEHAMMIDAGNRDDASLIKQYLEEKGISKLDYLLFTHPHEDHIGSGAMLLREMTVERVIMPDISIDLCETATYADLLAAIEEKEPIVDYPKAGEVYVLGEMSFKIVAPSPDWQNDIEDLNESSLGVLLIGGENRVLVYGDGEWNCEQYMASQHDIETDVLIVGHHGSNSSSNRLFLEAVSPSYAVISCGKDNDYGYPHKEVLRRLEENDIEIYRTDMQGNILFSGNGKNITFLMKN